MDEPTEGLEPVLVEAVPAVLLRVRAKCSLSIILIEQYSRMALKFSSSIVVMDRAVSPMAAHWTLPVLIPIVWPG